jgi:uncharacterized membrane protein
MSQVNNPDEEQASGKMKAVHPATVHFPITLFPVSSIFLLLWLWQGQAFFLDASYWTFLFAVLAALIAGSSGILDYFTAPYPKHKQRGAEKTAKAHIAIGVIITATALGSGIYFLLENPMDNPALIRWFTAASFFESFLVLVQGFLGGLLVYKHHFGIEPRQL